MKIRNWVKLFVVSLLLAIIVLLPFIPGPPNRLVIALSVAAQFLGFFGLVLVPIGVIWVILEYRKPIHNKDSSKQFRAEILPAIAALMVLAAIYGILVTGLFIEGYLRVGLVGIIAGIGALIFALKKIMQGQTANHTRINPLPFYLIVIPLVSLMTRVYFTRPLSDYSRDYAIRKSQPLITSIEAYKNRTGEYPESLKDLSPASTETTGPSIMGILYYRYNKINDHYSLSFSQWLEWGSLEEIVLYDKNNLRNNLSGKQAEYDYRFDLHRVKGAFANHSAGHSDWQYFLVD